MINLSPKQSECLQIIKKYYKDTGELPTHVFVATELGVTRQRATALIAELVAKKALNKAKRFGMYSL